METKKVIVQTIQRLKEIKTENGLTNSQIMDKMTAKGYYVSETTLKRVFSPDAEKMSFRYQESIAPIAEVLYEEYGDTSSGDNPDELRMRIKERDKIIENLMIKIENMEKTSAQIEKMYADRRSLLESHISDLQAAVEILKNQIENKDQMFEKIMHKYILANGIDV